MSSPERTVVFSPQARADFTDILQYTQQQWGDEQRDRYEAALTQAIAALPHFPEAGERRPRLFLGCRVRFVERHVVYYRVLPETVEIMRILHERADPARANVSTRASVAKLTGFEDPTAPKRRSPVTVHRRRAPARCAGVRRGPSLSRP